MRIPFIQLSVVLGLTLLASSSAYAQRSIRLAVGQSHTVQVRGTITKVQVFNPRVADVATYTARGATIVGISKGTTEILITASGRRFKFSVTVSAVETSGLFKQVRSYLGRLEGIYPRIFGDTVILSGYALTAEDYGRASRAVKIFGNKVQNQVRFKKSAVQQINGIFRRTGLGTVKVNLIGGSLFLEGAVSSKSEMGKVDALLRTFGIKVENLLTVGGGRQVLIDVQFVEMRKSGLQNIGIQYPSVFTLSGGGSLKGEINLVPGGSETLDLKIDSPFSTKANVNLLWSNGYGRLLAQPKLVCSSGKAAEFLVGGEVPIPLISQNALSVEWKPFGIRLKIKPIADSLGNIQSEIEAEVSEVDRAVAVMNIPGFKTRKFKTHVSIKDGSSIVLGGLFSNSEEKAVNKFPLLGHIPILGELFKSREFKEGKTTLLIFVTPKVVTPEHPWVRKTIRDMQKMYEEYEAEVGWQVFD